MVVRIPRVSVPVCVVKSVVPVCVVSRCVFTSVLKCVLRRTHTGSVRACAKAPSCMDETPSETPCVPESPCVSETPCASVTPYVKETPRETPCATPSVTPCARETAIETPCASGVVTSVPECVLPGTPCVKGAPQGEETTCAREAAHVCEPPRVSETPRVSAPACVGSVVYVCEARVSELPCMRVTACVRSLCEREMSVAMREHVAASPGTNVNVMCSMSLAARGSVSARVAWRLRLRLWREKCRVAAVVAIGTGPGLHGRARVGRAVPRTRPPRARLRG